ncbi:MAG TPA: DMT family transporter [Ignavibacteria bacterium]|nr:DMT family transporter [Ignavibacteria bacterium]HMR40938.1 DMT family transporter [Ignavibacteria bacterium]
MEPSKLFWIILAFFSGAFLPIQAALNTKLSKAGNSPVHASMLSFIIGTAALILYIYISRQQVSWEGLKTAPYYAWIGGILGAFYVTVIILAFPKLGPGVTFSLVVAGQLIFSVLLEHFNILDTPQHPVSLLRITGIVLIIAGVILVRKF